MKRIIPFIVIIVMCVFVVFLIGILTSLKDTQNLDQNSETYISLDEKNLITTSTVGYNSISVYQIDKEIIINAQSDTAFFDDQQFTVDVNEEITADDIEILWSGIGGKKVKIDENSNALRSELLFGYIIIKEDDKIVFEKTVNFAEKAIDAIEEVYENEMQDNKW